MNDKSLKTFNLRRSTIRIVRQKHNQSEFVDRAIVKLHNKEEELDVHDATARTLAIALKYKPELPNAIRILIEDWLRS